MHVQIETVAELAHEIIRALAHETDGTVMPPWSEAPEWMQKSSVEMVTAIYWRRASAVRKTQNDRRYHWMLPVA